MDDLKLYAEKEREVDSLINTVRIFSEDIGCVKLIAERGKVKRTDGLQLHLCTIKDVQVSKGYKYLGILQAQEYIQAEVKSE